MKHFTKFCLIMLMSALLPKAANGYDFKEGGLFFNVNQDGKSVTLTYEVPIMFALDAPAPTEKGYIGNIVIPSKVKHDGKTYTVTAVSDYAFCANSELLSVVIPASVKAIGKGAFMQCYRLQSVQLPPALTEISDYLFAESSLPAVTLPGKVKHIGESAFNSCRLKSLNIPNSVETIGRGAFSSNRQLEELTMGNSVTTIGEGAFSLCPALRSFSFPHSLKTIEPQAFNECGALTTVTIPASVTSIGSGAFSNCEGLTSIKVATGNKRFDSRDNCNAIIETGTNTLVAGCNGTTVPASVSAIGDEAFYGCDSLTTVDLPASVTKIGYRAYFYCHKIRSVNLPNSVTSIGSYAFVGCDSLETVEIPNSVTTIADDAFLHDDHIKTVTIGSGVTSIGAWAFKGLDAVKSITSKIVDATSVDMGDDVFDEINKETCTLYVPRGSAERYSNAPQWRDFKHIVEIF